MEHLHSVADTILLNSGVSIPCIGYGTWQLLGEPAENCVKEAIAAGYRHIDTAADYKNEADVGNGIRTSGIAREELFVTTKCWVTERGYEKSIAAAEHSISLLGLDYLDLYLIHWPCVAKANDNWKEINRDTWRGFEAMVRAGKIRSIGVSNFLQYHLEALMEDTEILPAVNQIEFHPGFAQLETVRWCQEHGIVVEAWSPLGSGKVLQDEFLKAIAEKYGKSVAQLCIRYALQHSVVPVVKSGTLSNIRANMDVFDFVISEEDMDAIDAMLRTGCMGVYPDDAPCG